MTLECGIALHPGFYQRWKKSHAGAGQPRNRLRRSALAPIIVRMWRVPLTVALAAALTLAACSAETVPHSDIVLQPLQVAAWQHDVLLRGTPIEVVGDGFLAPELGAHALELTSPGAIVSVPLTWVDESTLRYVVDDMLLATMPPGTQFDGTATITRQLFENGAMDVASQPAVFRVESNLTPTLTSFVSEGGVLYPGDVVNVGGSGFLLKGEGHTVLLLEGSFVTHVPPETRAVQAVLPVNGETRDTLLVTMTPDVLGIRPGIFQGSISVSNETPAGQVAGSGLSQLTMQLLPPRVSDVVPKNAARGQRITVVGRGFLATDPYYEATTLIRLEGAFTASKTSQVIQLDGPTALALFPDLFYDNTMMDYILRVTQTPSGELEGLGLIGGGFDGTIRPMLISGPETILGEGIALQLTIAPQKQVVYVKYLPGFSTTVAEMGLGAVEPDIKGRVAQVLQRDYAGINIEFRESRPEDFVEYSIIEVGGADPNGAGLFGLDNTAGKDVGNLRFNDTIGGTNAETAEQGYYAFGGVFVRSFFQLSPSLPDVEPLPIATTRFDDLFGVFMPALGGTPATPGDSRQLELQAAVRALGNLVGNTVTHEIGHSLGLANIEGEFHNIGDNEAQIMDAGNFRPFEERTEIDGQGPAAWSANNRAYLERILPLE